MDGTTQELHAKPLSEPAKSLTQWGKGPAPKSEERFLQGPQPRGFELMRALRLFWETMRGFRTLHFVGPCVTVFGSARFTEDQPYYQLARPVGASLARVGFTVMTTRSAATSNCFTSRNPTRTSTAGSPSSTSPYGR
jgi:hypothetical protein